MNTFTPPDTSSTTIAMPGRPWFCMTRCTWRFVTASALIAGVLAAVAAPARVSGAPPTPKTSADFKRKMAEHKRQAEFKHRQMKAEHQRRKKEILQDASKRSTPSKGDSSPPFHASGAPAPEECLKSYIAAARGASSMEQLLRYLPDNEAKALKERQAQYDPKEAARGREWHRKQSPDMKPETLDFLSNPPYTNELHHHRQIAAKILDILSVTIDGDKAVARVSTTGGATVNGVHYPYGTAKIEMIGQGNSWRISAYNDSNMAYLEPPQKE